MNSTAKQFLDTAFLDALEQLAKDESGPNWWRDVLTHPDLVLAVRHNYLNVYCRGASIFRIEWKDCQVMPFTHIKYLMRNLQSYVPLENGHFQLPASPRYSEYDGPKTLNGIVAASKKFAGAEKSGLHPMLVGNGDVIDVEIALSLLKTGAEDDENIEQSEDQQAAKQKQVRLDAAIAVSGSDGTPTIRFYEAKDFSNPALRAKDVKLPPVIEQIEDYEKALQHHEKTLSARYVEVARALMRLSAMRGKETKGHVIRRIAEGFPPKIENKPRLIIYGFDNAQKNDENWKIHLKKLEEKLHVRCIGKPTPKTVFE